MRDIFLSPANVAQLARDMAATVAERHPGASIAAVFYSNGGGFTHVPFVAAAEQRGVRQTCC
jgi:hypothetical protein